MSFSVVRGEPYPSQLYLDGILDEVLQEKGIQDPNKRNTVSIAQLLYHCLKKYPDDVLMKNGATNEVLTNHQILTQAISLARTLISKSAKGKTIILMMRNHQYMVAIYLASMFAGTKPFNMDPNSTIYEISYFLKLIEPNYVFCDQEHYDNISKALQEIPELRTKVIVSDAEKYLKAFSTTQSDDIDSFIVPDSYPESTVVMLPTSGSTGFYKAALITNKGVMGQLGTVWAHHNTFPKPTGLVMILTTPQWITFTIMFTHSVVYRVPILISPRVPTVEVVKEMLVKFRPTWTFFNPTFVKTLLPEISHDHLSSLETIIVLGSVSSTDLKESLKKKMAKSAHLADGYGTTEAQSFILLPDRETPVNSNGRILNIFYYKLIGDDGNLVKSHGNGELYVTGPTIIQSYFKNDSAYDETFLDGWYRTGDLFYIDENERLYFVERRKFSFKFRSCHVSPEEVESVIETVPGVKESVVCSTDDGPAAAIVVLPGFEVTREQIHQAVNDALSEHKRLHGGIMFVTSLPHTHNGKLLRLEARKIVLQGKETLQCIK